MRKSEIKSTYKKERTTLRKKQIMENVGQEILELMDINSKNTFIT